MKEHFLRQRSGLFVGILTIFISARLVQSANPPAENTKIQHGDYITHHVAMCVQCHTPRDNHGDLIQTKEFDGAVIPVQTLRWFLFAAQAPAIRGLAGWEADEAIHFLETGERYDHTRPQLPMPPFQMSKEDAEAVVSYLKSLH